MGEESKCEESRCCCAEGMADKLKKFKGVPVIVYERNYGGATFVDGTIRDVQEDGQILHLEGANKTIILSSGGRLDIPIEDLYINICEITEFFPRAVAEPMPITEEQMDTFHDQTGQNMNEQA